MLKHDAQHRFYVKYANRTTGYKYKYNEKSLKIILLKFIKNIF